MATINLAEIGGNSLVPEGEHIFKITNVNYKEAFGKLEIVMKTAGEGIHKERFSFFKSDKSINDGALKSFSFFAKTAMNDFSLASIDPNDLVGKYIKCGVEHTQSPSTKETGKMVTFSRLTSKSPATGYEEEISSLSPEEFEAQYENDHKDVRSMLD